MRIDGLVSRIRSGEDARLALTEVCFEGRNVEAPRREDLADELAAFANSQGGVLALGVSEATRTVTGIPLDRLDTVQDLVQKVCTDSIQPPLDAGIYRHEIEVSSAPRLDEPRIWKPILVVDVPRSSFVHQSPGGYFQRIGAVKRLGREEVPQYSEQAVFEALANAVAHRDYSIAGSRIRLDMFADRIEFHVPGGLANTLKTDTLHLRQATRNPLIVSLLARCPARPEFGRRRLMDQRGDGVPRIREKTQDLTGRLPEYSLVDDSELLLVLPAAVPF